ncbi:MAG: hypothetical protein HOP35_09335 [Nitrospira sp.]|nr:hypothetical protein [Nitrospira sp.]
MKQPFSKQSIGSLLGLALLVSGCQTGTPLKTVGLDNPGFMNLWGTYTHCKSTSDLGETQQAMGKLTTAALLGQGHDGFVLPMPQQLERFVATPASRLAVDVHAMAASCSLHAGQVAFSSGRVDLAREALTSVITLHKENQEPTYYLAQANKLLAEMENGVQISLKNP